jgi:hypothetical protein
MGVTCNNGSSKFFRRQILTLPVSEIVELSDKLDKDARALKKDILQICWYMRGMDYTAAMHLSTEERKIIGDIIKSNLETTKTSGLPFF